MKRFGYNAVGADSGVEAIARAADFCPTLLLSDIVVPELNGFETAIQIKAKCPGCRLLFFSGYTGTADLGSSLKAQGYRFEILPKPLHPAILVERIEAALTVN